MIQPCYKLAFFLCVLVLLTPGASSFASQKTFAASTEAQLTPITLQLKWKHQFQFAGYYAAQEKGFYREAGLDVSFKELDKGVDILEDVLSGRAQFGVKGSDLAYDYLQGKPVVVLAALFQHSPIIVMALKSSGISTPHDLIGRRLMWSRVLEDSIPAMLTHEGVSVDQLTIVKPDYSRDLLSEGVVDARSGYVTNQPFFYKQQGVPINIINPEEYGAHFYGDCLFTSKTMVENEPELVNRFLNASLKGWVYAMDHVEEIITLTKEKYHSKRSIEHLRYEAHTMRTLMLPDLIEIGHMNPGRWKSIARYYSQDAALPNPILSPPPPMDGFTYTPPSHDEYDWVHKLFPEVFIVFGAALALSLILIYFNRRLHVEVKKRTHQLENTNQELLLEISERQRVETELRAAQVEAVAANNAKSEFLANMSHEIRTPMNAIINMTAILLDGALTQEQRDYLQTVENSSEHLLTVINDILDISKIEVGKLEFERIHFDVHGAFRSAVELLTPSARAKGLALNLNIAGGSPRYALGDPARLRQVLMNLIGNAIKFTDQGQVDVTLSIPPIECALKPGVRDKVCVHFSVQDTGIGIPQDKIDSIFDIFTQADSSTSRQFGGTGLGLSICKKLAELQDGEIHVTSAEGQGSVFSFTIYYDPGDPQKVDNTSRFQVLPRMFEGRPMHILLAEDVPENIKVTSIFIEKLGHTLDVATNGQDALNMLAQHDFDLILMDVEMPGMGGLEATERIRAGEAGEKSKDLPIIALTAHALSGYKERCRQAGMNSFLQKPLSYKSLATMLGAVLMPPEAPKIQPPPASSAPQAPDEVILDQKSALDRFDQDMDLYESVLLDICNSLPQRMEELRRKFEHARDEEFTILVHSIKNSCGVIGAVACQSSAQKLEDMLKAGDRAQAKERVAHLAGEMARLTEHLEKTCKISNTPPSETP